MTTFSELARARKSVRSFLPTPVDQKIIERIIETATYAPTNCNQQLWNFVVVTDLDMKERLIKIAASNTLIRRAPALVVVTYDSWNYKEAIQGGALAVGHILFAAEENGLGALPMNSYGADTQIKRLLEIPESQTICCFVLLGYSDEKAKATPHVKRRPFQESIHFAKFNPRVIPSFKYSPETWTLQTLRDHQKYYSRKTFPGKEMDIMSDHERLIVKNNLSSLKGEVLDVCTYDGAYLREFPGITDINLHTLDLTPETSAYTKAAAQLSSGVPKNIQYDVYKENESKFSEKAINTVTFLYKAERLPSKLRANLLKQAYATLRDDGEVIIISRRSNIFLSFYFLVIRILFGPDVRKTGIYTFFGPYAPLKVSDVKKELAAAGFKNVNISGHFFFPPFYEQLYQMFLQFKKSEGSSYLHREKRITTVTRFLSWIIRLQGERKVGALGSVVVIKAKK